MHGSTPSYQSARGVDHAQTAIIPIDTASDLPLSPTCDISFTRTLGTLEKQVYKSDNKQAPKDREKIPRSSEQEKAIYSSENETCFTRYSQFLYRNQQHRACLHDSPRAIIIYVDTPPILPGYVVGTVKFLAFFYMQGGCIHIWHKNPS